MGCCAVQRSYYGGELWSVARATHHVEIRRDRYSGISAATFTRIIDAYCGTEYYIVASHSNPNSRLVGFEEHNSCHILLLLCPIRAFAAPCVSEIL